MTTQLRHVLITGGSGFIGSHLTRLLLSEPFIETITIFDLQPPKVTDPRVIYRATDLRQPIRHELDAPIDICFHLAALCKEPQYDWEEYFRTNHVGTRHLCDFAARTQISKIVFTSTMMVYRAGERSNKETDDTAPDTAYGISKLLAEGVLEKWAGRGERSLQIVRPAVVFGSGENGNFTRLYGALKQGRFAYVGRSDTRKACIYVTDLCRFARLLASSPEADGIYNAAIPNPLTIKEICDTFCAVFKINRWIPTVPFRLALLAGYCGDVAHALGVGVDLHHRRIEEMYYSTDIVADAMLHTGFRPAYSLEDGLVDWRDQCPPGSLY